MVEELKEKKESKQAKIVPYQVDSGFVVELPNGDKVDALGILVEIYNDIQKIKKGLA